MMRLSKLALSSSCRFEGSSGTASAGTVAMSLTLARSSWVSVGLFGFRIPVIERASRGDALELATRMRQARCGQQFFDRGVIALAHGLETRIGTERAHLAAHVDDRLVERIPEAIASIP